MRRISLALFTLIIFGLILACGNGPASESESSSEADPEPQAPAGSLVVRMLYGSEKEAWIEAVTEAFNNQQHASSSGKPIYIEAVPIGSRESLDLILSGKEQPVIWSPASNILVPIANREWGSLHDGANLVEEDPPELVLSPVIIAMWQPMAEVLGWPDEPIGWADIAEITRQSKAGQTWADLGGEAFWGPFQFGHTHPDYSNSGITSILSIVYAAVGKTRDLTLAEVQQPEVSEFVEDVESGVIHYGRSTGFFARQMFNRGPSYLSAAVMYENLVIESYNEALYPDIPLPVVAIYPSEGTFWSDHPFTILNAPWVDEELRAAAEMYRDYLLATPQQERALEFGFRPASLDVEIGAPIVPEHGVDPSEPQTLLSVPEAEVIEEVRDIWGANKKRVEVQVVLDISGSMEQEQRLQRAKEALVRFVEQLADEDQLGIVVFSDEASVLTPLEEIGPRRQEVIEQINGLFPNGGTRLIDTVSEVYQQLEQEPAGERIRAMVVLSDGDDNMSQGTDQTLMDVLGGDESGQSIKVFTIAYGTGTDVNLSLLTTIAEASGAKLYESTPGEITEVYLDIATFF